MTGGHAAQYLALLWALVAIYGGIHFLRKGHRTYPWGWRRRSPFLYNAWSCPPEERPTLNARMLASTYAALGFCLFAIGLCLIAMATRLLP